METVFDKPRRSSFYRVQAYHSLVFLAGAALLVWTTARGVPGVEPVWTGLFLALFAAALPYFSLDWSQTEVDLVHSLAWAGGLLAGAAAAGWALALGALLGAWLRRGRDSRLSGSEILFAAGRQVLPLVLVLSLAGWERGLPLEAPGPGLRLMAVYSLLYAGLHAALILLDAVLRRPVASLPGRDLASLALLELFPLPFGLWAVVFARSAGVITLLFLGGSALIAAFLLHQASRARRELRRRDQELEALRQISQVLSSGLELEELLSAIHLHISRLLGGDHFYVAVYSPDEKRVWYPLAVGQGERQHWPPRPLEDRLTDRVILSQEPLLIANRAASENLPPSAVTPMAWMGVPLISSDRAIGCLAIYSLSPRAEFRQSDLDLLAAFSGQISVAIENALRYDQALLQVETLVHDLRSPLTAIIGSLDMIAEAVQNGDVQGDLVPQAAQVARRSSRRIQAMVESLLDISRLKSGRLELSLGPVRLEELVETVVADFLSRSGEYGVSLRSQLPPDLPETSADRVLLTRVLSNLLDNALKFTPEGGQVQLMVEAAEGRVKIKVSDTGPGVPPAYREKIFERFTQVPSVRGRRRGFGLGLAFCRAVVEAHGGRIWVDPNPGGGSVFTLTLPVLREQLQPANI